MKRPSVRWFFLWIGVKDGLFKIVAVSPLEDYFAALRDPEKRENYKY